MLLKNPRARQMFTKLSPMRAGKSSVDALNTASSFYSRLNRSLRARESERDPEKFIKNGTGCLLFNLVSLIQWVRFDIFGRMFAY